MATFAGGIAEVWFLRAPFRNPGFMDDWCHAADALTVYYGNRFVAGHAFQRILKETVDWFMKPRYMKAVARLANALGDKHRMVGVDAERIIRTTGLKPLSRWVCI